jgi:hypothetical protein
MLPALIHRSGSLVGELRSDQLLANVSSHTSGGKQSFQLIDSSGICGTLEFVRAGPKEHLPQEGESPQRIALQNMSDGIPADINLADMKLLDSQSMEETDPDFR